MNESINVLLGFACIAYGFINFLTMIWMLPESMTMKRPLFLREMITEKIFPLFYNKNSFGVILSIIIVVFIIPAILLIVIVQIVFIILCGAYYLYKLGNKKPKEKDTPIKSENE